MQIQKNRSLSVLIPAYNEQMTLKDLYEEIRRLCVAEGLDWEIIFCDDASQDQTPQIIAKIAASEPRVKVMTHTVNQGIYKTFEDLYRCAKKDFVILLPGDGQWPANAILQTMAVMTDQAVVIAARRDKHYTPFRWLNSWMFNRLVRLFFGVELYDIGSVKLWRRDVLQSISVDAKSLFNEAERLIKAHRQGRRIGMVVVDHRPRVAGEARGAKLSNIVDAFKDLLSFALRSPKA